MKGPTKPETIFEKVQDSMSILLSVYAHGVAGYIAL